MDGLDSEKVEEIIWKRSKTQLNVAAEKEDTKKHKDVAGGSNHGELPRTCDPAPSFALPLVPIPKVEEWCSNTKIVLAGTACCGGTGPPVGVVDIGISKSAYYFCISLPGVKKDPGKFFIFIFIFTFIFFQHGVHFLPTCLLHLMATFYLHTQTVMRGRLLHLVNYGVTVSDELT